MKKLLYKWAVKLVIKKLKKDKEKTNSMFYTWQSSIAISFIDEYTKQVGRDCTINSFEVVHKVANQAAKDFLNLLIESK
jgi:hypothetical protein